MQMISLQNNIEKIINDSINVFLFKILTLSRSNFLYMYRIVCIELFQWWVTFESNCI